MRGGRGFIVVVGLARGPLMCGIDPSTMVRLPRLYYVQYTKSKLTGPPERWASKPFYTGGLYR